VFRGEETGQRFGCPQSGSRIERQEKPRDGAGLLVEVGWAGGRRRDMQTWLEHEYVPPPGEDAY
jgi:hypothetical protein